MHIEVQSLNYEIRGTFLMICHNEISKSVRWLQRILDVCQAYVESHGIIFNYCTTKLFV